MIENPLTKQAEAPVVQAVSRDGKNHDVSGINGGSINGVPTGTIGRMQRDMFDMATPGAPARDGGDHDTTGVAAGDITGGKSYSNMGAKLPNNFAQDVGRWGIVDAVRQHAPGWGKWLGANTVTGGSIPNWAVMLGLLGAGGLGVYGLKNLLWGDREKNAAMAGIAKEAMARAMSAQDPAYMGVVTPSHPDVTAGNGLARLVEALRTHENGRFGPELPTQR